MSAIKLVYFDGRGRGEIIRLVLEAAGKKYQEERITFEDWPSFKHNAPYGQLPYIEYNGKVYGQSYAIASFLAKEFGLYGRSNQDALRIDEVYGLCNDQSPGLTKGRFGPEDQREKALKKVLEDDMPKFLGFVEGLLADNNISGFFVGTTISLADLVVYDMQDNYLQLKKDCLKGYPLLQKLRQNVRAHPFLNAYLANRKETRF